MTEIRRHMTEVRNQMTVKDCLSCALRVTSLGLSA